MDGHHLPLRSGAPLHASTSLLCGCDCLGRRPACCYTRPRRWGKFIEPVLGCEQSRRELTASEPVVHISTGAAGARGLRPPVVRLCVRPSRRRGRSRSDQCRCGIHGRRFQEIRLPVGPDGDDAPGRLVVLDESHHLVGDDVRIDEASGLGLFARRELLVLDVGTRASAIQWGTTQLTLTSRVEASPRTDEVNRMRPAFAAPYSGEPYALDPSAPLEAMLTTAPPPSVPIASRNSWRASIGARRLTRRTADHSDGGASGNWSPRGLQPPALFTSARSGPARAAAEMSSAS